MRRRILPALVVLAASSLLALLAFGVSRQGANTSIDSQVQRGVHPAAPNSHLALPVLGASGTQSLSSYRGKVVVMNVFASWCGPCASEAPVLERAQRLLAGSGATILGVTYLDTSPAAEQFVRRHHLTYPVLRDINGDFVRSYAVTGVPETFVIDRRGRIAALLRSPLDTKWLARMLPPILAGRA